MATSKRIGDHQEFYDRSGQLVRVMRGAGNRPETVPVGRAYGFFRCDQSIARIKEQLPNFTHAAEANDLELSLMQDDKFIATTKNSTLRDLATLARIRGGTRYVVKAKRPNATNEQTADALGNVFSMASSSELYTRGERFEGDIVYKDGSDYLFK